jgi:hypothetical protein
MRRFLKIELHFFGLIRGESMAVQTALTPAPGTRLRVQWERGVSAELRTFVANCASSLALGFFGSAVQARRAEINWRIPPIDR